MSPELMLELAPVIAIFGVGTVVLIGLKMRYNYLRQTRVDQGGHENIAQLSEDLGTLRDEVRQLRQDFPEIHERMDFAERVLIRGQGTDREPPTR